MSTTKEEKRHEELLGLISDLRNSSPALNGEFTKMASTVEKIREQQTSLGTDMAIVMERQAEGNAKIINLHDAIYEPKEGLYKKISDKSLVDQKQREDIDDLEEKAEKIKADVEHHKDEIKELDSTNNNLKKVAGERLEHLDNLVKTNKNVKKVFWVAVVGIVGILIKEFGPILLALIAI